VLVCACAFEKRGGIVDGVHAGRLLELSLNKLKLIKRREWN
jgi:hypothetical protein